MTAKTESPALTVLIAALFACLLLALALIALVFKLAWWTLERVS